MEQPSPGGDGSISLNPPQLTVPAGERMAPVRVTDWQRVRSDVQGLSAAQPALGNVGWTFLGIAISTGLAIPPWLAAYSDLTRQGQNDYVWVTSALFAAAIAALLVSAVAFIAARAIRGANQATVSTVLRDMDAMVPPERVLDAADR